MAVYRQFKIGFWQDDFVMELSPEEKYFYIYLMTNSKTTQCGIYRISKRLMEMETGYNRDTIDKLLDRFIVYEKIAYSEQHKEIMILNWVRYNFINSKNTIACINKELKEVRNDDFLVQFYNNCKKEDYPIDVIFKGIEVLGKRVEQEEISHLEAPCKELGEEKEEEKTEISEVIKEFSENIHMPSPIEIEKINAWCEDMNEEVVILAIKEAVYYNARNLRYIEMILNNWFSENLKTKEAIRVYQENHRKKHKKKHNKEVLCTNAGAYKYV